MESVAVAQPMYFSKNRNCKLGEKGVSISEKMNCEGEVR